MSNEKPDQNQDNRFDVGCSFLFFIPFAAGGAWCMLFNVPKPQGLFEVVLFSLLQELAITATLFFSAL